MPLTSRKAAHSPNPSQTQLLNIGYTLGDLAGIGPEIFYKFQASHSSNPNFHIKLIDDRLSTETTQNKINLGKASAYSGEHCYKTLIKADQMLKNGEIDYLITGPVSKESLWLAGLNFSGQTELIASINNLSSEDIEMFFILDDFRVVLATRHIPLSQVRNNLERRLPAVLNNSLQAMQNIFGISRPRIGVASLNPHAGENGIIGKEEQEFITPLLNDFAEKHSLDITGPLPADVLFAQAVQNYLRKESLNYDLYVAAYHDQALPVVKGLGGFRAINLTVGLPYIRLSVDHGTGYDIAGKGIANPLGLAACSSFALELAAN